MHDLTHIAVFTRVVDSRSFTEAARQLELSKATVSKHVSAIEARLGARLLNRTTRTLSLTEVGARFYDHCRRIMAELEYAEAEVRELSGAPRGRLRVSAPTSFGFHHVAPALTEFLERYPQIEIDLSLGDGPPRLIERGFDLAIRVARAEVPPQRARRLADCPHVVCAAPSYRARRGSPLGTGDLAGHDCLTCDDSATGDSWRLDGPNGPEAVKVSGRLRVNNADALRMAVLSGLGLGLMPTFLVNEDLRARRLYDALPGYRDDGCAIFALLPQDRHVARKVEAFVEFLAQRCVRAAPEWAHKVGAR